MPLSHIAAYMGPATTVGERSAMTYLATGVDLREAGPLAGRSRFDAERAVMATLREAIACQNAGSFTQSVALYTQDYFQRAGTASYRPDGSESQLATPQPLPAENRTEILDIGDLARLDDGRIGVIVITASHTEPIAVTAAYVILAPAGDRWLIDDAIPIDASGDPSGYVIPATPPEPSPTPTAATVSAEARAVVEDYFAEPTSTPAVATPTEPSRQATAQPNFPVGATVDVRGTTVNLRALPRTNGEIVARLGPCACAMEVTGPMADSGDALWLPVTDLDTGVSGYVSLEFVLPPEHMSQAGFQMGQTILTIAPLRLRGVPEPSRPAEPALPAGTSLRIATIKISTGFLWVGVDDPNSSRLAWAPWDLLILATANDAPTATPAPTPDQLTFPLDSTVAGRPDSSTTFLRARPRLDSEFIAWLSPAERTLRVSGPLTDSGNGLWLPVTDEETGVFGYIALNHVLPPEHVDQSSYRVGDTYTTTQLVHLRRFPEATIEGDSTLPAGTTLEITDTMFSAGFVWIQVVNPDTGEEGWIHPDVLLAATATGGPPVPTETQSAPQGSPDPRAGTPTAESTSPDGTPSFGLVEQVTVNEPLVNLRESPSVNALVIGQLDEGDELEIIGPSVEADGETWYPVRKTGDAVEGFVVAQFLDIPSRSATTSGPSSHLDQPEFAVGEIVAVGEVPMNLRSSPSYQETIVSYLEPGTGLRITGAPIAGDEAIIWYPAVELASGTAGFVVGHLLQPADSSPTTPTPSPQ